MAIPRELLGQTPRPLPAWAPTVKFDVAVLVLTGMAAAATGLFFATSLRSDDVGRGAVSLGIGGIALIAGIGTFIWHARIRSLLANGTNAPGRVVATRFGKVKNVKVAGVDDPMKIKQHKLRIKYEYAVPGGEKLTSIQELGSTEIGKMGRPSDGATAYVVYDPKNPARSLVWGFDLDEQQQQSAAAYAKPSAVPTIVFLVIFLVEAAAIAGGAWGFTQAKRDKEATAARHDARRSHDERREARRRERSRAAGAPAAPSNTGPAASHNEFPIECHDGDRIRVEDVVADVDDVGVRARGNCQVTLENCTLSGAVGIEAYDDARVRVMGGSISGTTGAIGARQRSIVTVSPGTKVTGRILTREKGRVLGVKR